MKTAPANEAERARGALEDEATASIVRAARVEKIDGQREANARSKAHPHPRQRLVRGYPDHRQRTRAEQAGVVADEAAERCRVVGVAELTIAAAVAEHAAHNRAPRDAATEKRLVFGEGSIGHRGDVAGGGAKGRPDEDRARETAKAPFIVRLGMHELVAGDPHAFSDADGHARCDRCRHAARHARSIEKEDPDRRRQTQDRGGMNFKPGSSIFSSASIQIPVPTP